jgi:hypothetical protein
MSTKLAVISSIENGGQRRFSSEIFRRRFTAFASFLNSVSDGIEKRWIGNRFWDRAAPTVFALFMASLVAVLVLSYSGVQIV